MKNSSDITFFQNHSQQFKPLVSIIKQIQNATHATEIFELKKQLPPLINNLLAYGINTYHITHILTIITDNITKRFLDLAQKKLGPAPTKFVFLALGSEGRQEQTFKADQDNALIFSDVPKESLAQTKKYFLALSKQVCAWLHEVGYTYCKGRIMAKNPKWCQPMSVWKNYFQTWIKEADAKSLLDITIFFDFRAIAGDQKLATQLQQYVAQLTQNQAPFFLHLAKNCLNLKPPIGLFKNILVEHQGKHKKEFSLKKALMGIVAFARIYALKHHIQKTNTQERLEILFTQKLLPKPDEQELLQAYDYLMKIRLAHQIELLTQQHKPDNYLNPKELTVLEQQILKDIFTAITNLQTKLSLDFTGTT